MGRQRKAVHRAYQMANTFERLSGTTVARVLFVALVLAMLLAVAAVALLEVSFWIALLT